jgi:hypothetical protein
VTLPIAADAYACFDEGTEALVVEEGVHVFHVGWSAAELPDSWTVTLAP